MNIESLLNKIKIFRELVVDSGFKRDVTDFKQSIAKAHNQNLVFMKDLSEKVKESLTFFENNSLDSELKSVLRENEPFTSLETLSELEEVDSDSEIAGPQYFQKFNAILNRLQSSIQSNETELNQVKKTFDKYVSDNDEYDSEQEQAVMSLIFKDLESTGSLKEFSKLIPLKLNSEDNTNNEIIKIKIVKKYLFISLKSKLILVNINLFMKIFFGLLNDKI